MIDYSTIVERAFTGPLCLERDFELGTFVPNLRSVLSKYAIEYDPQNPVPADDDLADRVWEAASYWRQEGIGGDHVAKGMSRR